MRVGLHIVRLVAILAVLLQAAMPLAQARAAADGTPLSSLICNPSGQALTASAQAQMAVLLETLGQSEAPEPMPDCERCVVPGVAILQSLHSGDLRPAFSLAAHQHPASARVSMHRVRGPPCGTRAPPIFV